MSERYVRPDGFRVISGGQTGAGRAGLDWAIEQGVPHGGRCPKRRKAEDGAIDRRYRLTETGDSVYLLRTKRNAQDSDATLIFTLSCDLSGGSRKTAEFAENIGIPYRHVHPGTSPEHVMGFLSRNRVRALNVAGKRES